MPRLPTTNDFETPIYPTASLPVSQRPPSPPQLDIVPPDSTAPVNVLILLHGLGDTKAPFTQLAQNMKLKETVCLSLQGPKPLPDIFNPLERPAFHWGDDINFDSDSYRLNFDAGFKTTSSLLSDRVIPVLVEKCNFPTRNVFLFGFGQGGMAALHAVTQHHRVTEFGGVISIGGRFPDSTRVTNTRKNKTPVLVCAGRRSHEVRNRFHQGQTGYSMARYGIVNEGSLHTLKENFEDVEYVKWDKDEDSMPKTTEEMRPIFAFLGRRMQSRAGVPEGAVEI